MGPVLLRAYASVLPSIRRPPSLPWQPAVQTYGLIDQKVQRIPVKWTPMASSLASSTDLDSPTEATVYPTVTLQPRASGWFSGSGGALFLL